MRVLVLQPIRPSHPPALRAVADALLARMVETCTAFAFDVRQDDAALDVPPHRSKYQRHATVRNYMLDCYLRPEHDAVLWVDSDLIDYPADLPLRLHAANPGGITAPLALLSETSGWKDRFYDIGGFIENGARARMFRPWFEQQCDVIELDSVGCCYLAPADLYRAGVRYAPPPTDYYVEHWSVMKQARERGYRVCCLTTARAVHAWLPDYGLGVN